MGFGSAALKLGSTALYAIEFACAAIVLGIYSYFLSVQADRNVSIDTWQKAVTGLAGGVVLYTIFAVLLTCFLGGKTIFALLGMLFNILCCGAMVAIAVMTRDGAHSCSGFVRTPLGDGDSNSREGFGSNGQGNQITYAASLGTTCRLNTACFAVSIGGALLFLISALLQFCLRRNHKKEKAFGPGPSNNYTKGSGVKFWQRNRRAKTTGPVDPEVGTVPVSGGGLAPPVAAHDYRASHDTAYTGSTVTAPGSKYEHNKPVTGGYHTAPAGTYQSPATNY
ncbi:hypothetical protein IAQ61_009245 [Plenodomus lingam]|uniref:MARVEL domain-containing protein n=1 Tax=Leptosphaeria maculans (strain JN3 / isolate v23.1.3 / race Av1-4-5-6-7-8) TaxID=985895 RepID=E4ZQ22_LEPMJ|nr:hypothetical protein LEMA_P044580.1 [Plenodomus lingam JN3]KAH9865298.1 hypothetical protein IAQ61_009245 [Plenodomus lingam]CBX93557.1 hypothetical protein LEMA_P044580.1 [Plenodomus lingam JN3]